MRSNVSPSALPCDLNLLTCVSLLAALKMALIVSIEILASIASIAAMSESESTMSTKLCVSAKSFCAGLLTKNSKSRAFTAKAPRVNG